MRNHKANIAIQHCCRKGTAELNEDAIILNDQQHIYGVVDGATSVTPYVNERGQTGGYLAAHLLASSFHHNLSPHLSLADMVMQVNRLLREQMIAAGIDTADKSQLWSAAFCVIRIRDTQIEYVQAGDCMLVAKYEDGTYRILTRDQVAPFDELSLKAIKEAKQRGLHSMEQIREYILPVIRRNRSLANTIHGYAVLNGDPELGDFLESGTVSRACLCQLYIMTDGLSFTVEEGSAEDVWLKTVSAIDQMGLQQYADYIEALEQADAACEKFARFKVSDDKTGIVIKL